MKTTPSGFPHWYRLCKRARVEGAAGALNSCVEAGVGRLEAETVPSLDGADLLGEAVGHRETFLRPNIGGGVSSEASHCLSGQRRRYEQPLRLEVQ